MKFHFISSATHEAINAKEEYISNHKQTDPELADVIISIICPIGKKIDTLKKDKAYLSKVLKDGNDKARLIAEKNMKEVREIVGFL